jgi:ribosomal protein L40E
MAGAAACASFMLSMLPHQCRFCGHVNPDGAKYCNECGSQLNLKPCRLCDAINDVAAEHCHKCGAALPEQSVPALAPVAAVAALSGAVAPRRELEPTFSVGDSDAMAGDSDEGGAADARPGAPPDDRGPSVGTHPLSRLVWVAAALATVGIAAYLAYSPERVDDAGGASRARPTDPARVDAPGGTTSTSPALPAPTSTATSSSGASEQVPVAPGAPGSSSITTGVGAETSAAGVSNPASGVAALVPGASPGVQPSTQSTASPAAAQAGKAKAKPKAKPKPKPKANPKSRTAK